MLFSPPILYTLPLLWRIAPPPPSSSSSASFVGIEDDDEKIFAASCSAPALLLKPENKTAGRCRARPRVTVGQPHD